MSNPDKNSAFDEYADHYGSALNRGLSVSGEGPEYFARRRVEWLKSCLRTRGEAPKHVLDFGCGTGLSIPFFFETLGADQVVGVDMSIRSLDFARDRHGHDRAQFLKLDYQNVPAPQDLVFCNGVFHHILPDERGVAVDYIYRSLRPGGMLSLWDNNPWNPGARWVMSRIPFDRGAIMLSARAACTMLISAGFEIVGTDFLFIFPHSLRRLRPVEAFASLLPLGAQYQILARKPATGQELAPAAKIVLNPLQWVHTNYVHRRRVHVLAEHLARLIPPDAHVLDVGTGDGWLADQIARLRPDIKIEGVDVLVRRDAFIPVRRFDGENIPYPDGSYDVVLFMDVLHHAMHPAGLLGEALRASRQSVIIKDHACEGVVDSLTLRLMDRVGNQRYSVALPFNYMSRSQWLALFGRLGARLDSWNDHLKMYPWLVRGLFERSLHILAVLKPGAGQNAGSSE